MNELKLYKSRLKAAKLVLLPSPFVIFSYYDLTTRNHSMSTILSWFLLSFFGLTMVLGFYNFFDRRPEIILNEAGLFSRSSYGIFDKRKSKGFIRWEHIKKVYINTYSNSYKGLPSTKRKLVCIDLSEEGLHQTKSKLARAFGCGDFNFPITQVESFDDTKFIVLIETLSDCDKQKRKELLITTRL